MRMIVIIFLGVLATSCGLNTKKFDLNYKGENNYKNFYVVDTIEIEDPVIIDYSGGRFISSRLILEKIKINDKFFKRPDVFLLGFDFYHDLFPDDYNKYSYPDYGNCKITTTIDKLNKDQIITSEYVNKPIRFILCLINANHYNVKHNSWDEVNYQIRSNDQKNSFYKIIYPICE